MSAGIGSGEGFKVDQLLKAEERAGILRQYQQLIASGISSRQASMQLKKSPSFFHGVNCPLERFKRDGLAGLVPAPREVPAQFQVPDWFIPAGRFFYCCSNYRRHGGSVPEAVRRTIKLPSLPSGWTKGHEREFLRLLKLSKV
ncbi:MAG: hypothetical protein ACREE6_09210, partial [Limisphaerales bacterium]